MYFTTGLDTLQVICVSYFLELVFHMRIFAL
jgi:hypothetical protein